jgi:hypothetical protein
MKNILSSPFTSLTSAAEKILLGVLLAAGTTTLVHAQGQIGSGTVSGSGAGPYDYSLSFSDAAGATSPIGSVWYAWVPGAFYLPSAPTTAVARTGWTASIVSSGGKSSIQFVASSSTFDITAGESLSGFGYDATFSPAQLAAAPNSGTSVAYSAGLFSDNGNTFTVQAVPEPSTYALVLSGVTALWFVRRQKLLTV